MCVCVYIYIYIYVYVLTHNDANRIEHANHDVHTSDGTRERRARGLVAEPALDAQCAMIHHPSDREFTEGGLVKGGLAIYVLLLCLYCSPPY